SAERGRLRHVSRMHQSGSWDTARRDGIIEVKRVAAILLAAGRSRRMGAFKPLLPFGPQTVIESTVANLRAGGVTDIIVVVGHRGEEIREKLKAAGVSFAFN